MEGPDCSRAARTGESYDTTQARQAKEDEGKLSRVRPFDFEPWDSTVTSRLELFLRSLLSSRPTCEG